MLATLVTLSWHARAGIQQPPFALLALMCMVLTRRAKSCASAAHEASEPLQAQERAMMRTGRACGVIEVTQCVGEERGRALWKLA